MVSDDTEAILNEGEGDYRQLCTSVLTILNTIEADAAGAVEPIDLSVELADATNAVGRLLDDAADPHAALADLRTSRDGLVAAFNNADVAWGGWSQTIDGLDEKILALRERTP